MTDTYERIFRGLLFPFYEEIVRRRHTHSFLAEYEKTQWLSKQELAELQLEKLNALLAHSWKNVPFLRSYWADAGLCPEPIADLAELANYPVLTKQLITENFDDMRARNFNGKVLSKTTGGSTGEPFRLEYSEENYARRNAVMWRGYRWCGTDIGKRTAYLWGAGKPKSAFAGAKERLYHRWFNRILLSAFTMTESSLVDYAKAMKEFKPRIVVAYVAPLVTLSRWMLTHDFKMPTVESVITGAEALTEAERDIISSAFGAPVHNTYGCREFMLIASECSLRKGLHVSADHLVVETVNDTHVPVSGQSGDVCVTDLHNFAMPFVRYLNGDRATLSARSCECGRAFPLLETIDGRLLDTITTPDGRILPGEFFIYALLDFLTVRNYQFVQTAEDRIELRIVPAAGFSAQEKEKIIAKLRDFIGQGVEIVIREVDHIATTATGKRRVTISEIK